MSTDQRLARGGTLTMGASLRLATSLLLAGQVIFILVTQFHTGGDANDHPSIFAKYAHSGDWKGVHAVQFLATAVIVAGLVVLSRALEAGNKGAALAARIGAVLAVVSLALYGVLQAVDGVGNKQVDQAYVNASAAQQPARFASAESMRWLEWGVSSYHAYAIGLSLVLLAAAAAAARTVVVALAVPVLMGLSGIAYLVEGWVAGSEGFTATHSTLIVMSWALSLVWMIWMLVLTRRSPHGADSRITR
jgi:hypothetical protein